MSFSQGHHPNTAPPAKVNGFKVVLRTQTESYFQRSQEFVRVLMIDLVSCFRQARFLNQSENDVKMVWLRQ